MGFIHSALLSTFLLFITLLIYFALNELAKGLEDPFIYDPNDLPLTRHHYDFNERLLAIARTKRPLSNRELSEFPLVNILKKGDCSSSEKDLFLSDTSLEINELRAMPLNYTEGKLTHFLGGNGVHFRVRSTSPSSSQPSSSSPPSNDE